MVMPNRNAVSETPKTKRMWKSGIHTCFFSIVHWFIAQCIFSIPKPTLSIESFVNICSVNCSPGLQKEEILFSQGPFKRNDTEKGNNTNTSDS